MVRKRIVSAPVRIDISSGWPDSPPYRDEFGGDVLNVAIDKRVRTTFDLEKGTLTTEDDQALGFHGLGASGARDATYLIASEPNNSKDPYGLIKKVWVLQNNLLLHRGGFQDQSAAIFGGGDLWRFGAGPVETMNITRDPLSPERLKYLEQCLVLFNTGESRLSSNIHDEVFGKGNYPQNIPLLRRMSEIAREMSHHLDNFPQMARLMSETWNLQRELHPLIETNKMRELQNRFRGRYSACKATGAGGGGFLIFLTDEPEAFAEVATPFKFDYQGIKIEEYD